VAQGGAAAGSGSGPAANGSASGAAGQPASRRALRAGLVPGQTLMVAAEGGYVPAAELAKGGGLKARMVGDGVTDRPALQDTLELYRWLYRSNFSVAFVTGRKEDARCVGVRSGGKGPSVPAPRGPRVISPREHTSQVPCCHA
jgi:hypothetical protein